MRITLAAMFLLSCEAWAQDPPPLSFEVASVKRLAPGSDQTPSGGGGGRAQVPPPATSLHSVQYSSVTLKELVRRAYGVTQDQVAGPVWIATEHYRVVAKWPDGATQGDIPRMLQSLLAERFQLAVHHEERSISIYALVAAKGGSKLKPGDDSALKSETASNPRWGDKLAEVGPGTFLVNLQGGHLVGKNVTMAKFADFLRARLDRPVLDQTELPATYSFALDWLPDDLPGLSAAVPAADDRVGLPLPGAIQAQLGLRLDKRNSPMDVLVIDRAEKIPTGN